MDSRTYVYLDSEQEREQLIREIRQVRAAVLQIVDIVPQSEWYTPRYHGWSLAAMLGHLNTADQCALLLIQAALLGIRPPVHMPTVHRANAWMSRVYRARRVDTSRQSISKTEARIAAFIRRLPVSQFSKSVYYPPFEQYTTVEKALQDYFIYHWQEHLQTLRKVEGIPQPPRADGQDRLDAF
jgi:hypothetical protein